MAMAGDRAEMIHSSLHFRELARELNLAIAITYLEKWRERPRNSVS